jgi:hypothetical protein
MGVVDVDNSLERLTLFSKWMRLWSDRKTKGQKVEAGLIEGPGGTRF